MPERRFQRTFAECGHTTVTSTLHGQQPIQADRDETLFCFDCAAFRAIHAGNTVEITGMFVIAGRSDRWGDTYWSNDGGWVDRGSATLFTADERNTLNLPDEGKWESA